MSSSLENVLCRYHYDSLDRLVGSTSLTKAHTQHFYLKEHLTSETQGSVQRSIFQQDDQLLAQQQRQHGAVEATLLATDQQRTVLHALGAIAYTPYGHRPAKNELLSLLGFSGERPDRVTGHYLLGNGYRAFNPVLMRFNSPDSLSPFGKGGLNAYGYCTGDPINRVDPTGEFGIPLVTIQRALTIALHSIVPAGMIFGPKASGAALWATRVSLAGSTSNVVGAALQLTGNKFGPLVSTIGTTALVTGAAVRGALAVHTAYKTGRLGKTVMANIKNILGLSVPTNTPASKNLPAVTLSTVTVRKPSAALSVTDELPQKAEDIRRSTQSNFQNGKHDISPVGLR